MAAGQRWRDSRHQAGPMGVGTGGAAEHTEEGPREGIMEGRKEVEDGEAEWPAGEASAKAGYDRLRGRGGERREHAGGGRRRPGHLQQNDRQGANQGGASAAAGTKRYHDRGARSGSQQLVDQDRLPPPPPGYPSFGNTAGVPSRAPAIHWLHRASVPPAPRWVRADEGGESDSLHPDCGWKCVPKSVIAPFNPLSAYQHMTSPAARSHPPAWVRHDFEGGGGGGLTGGPGGGNQMPGPRDPESEAQDGSRSTGARGETLDSMWQTAQGGIPMTEVAAPASASKGAPLGAAAAAPGAEGTRAEEQLKEAVEHLGDAGGVRQAAAEGRGEEGEGRGAWTPGAPTGSWRAEESRGAKRPGEETRGDKRGAGAAEERKERYSAEQVGVGIRMLC